MIEHIAKNSIFCFRNSPCYFMRAEFNEVPCAVRLITSEVFTDADLIRAGYLAPEVKYEDLDALYFEGDNE